MPRPCPEQISVLDRLVDDLYQKYGLTQNELDQRSAVVSRLQAELKKQDCLKGMYCYLIQPKLLLSFMVVTTEINLSWLP